MDATIGYVGQVREDLMDAAFRTGRARRRRTRGGPRWLPSRRVAVVLASVLVVAAAGALGWFLKDGDGTRFSADRPASGATGATGATGGGDRAVLRDQAVFDAAVPAPQTYSAGQQSEPTRLARSGNAEAGFVAPEEAPAIEGSIPVRDPSRIIRTAQMTVVIGRNT
ncbi:MAG TPA: hypothetical protein VFT27_10890, partial [Actinomycetota bacterium]|nr:hypothetical protein [Actinomycetota bacterium]